MTTLYCVCRDWGLPPSEIWGMTLSEILHEYEWKRPKAQNDYAGGLTQGDLDELKDWMH